MSIPWLRFIDFKKLAQCPVDAKPVFCLIFSSAVFPLSNITPMVSSLNLRIHLQYKQRVIKSSWQKKKKKFMAFRKKQNGSADVKALRWWWRCHVEGLSFLRLLCFSAKLLSVAGCSSACMANCRSNSTHLQEMPGSIDGSRHSYKFHPCRYPVVVWELSQC